MGWSLKKWAIAPPGQRSLLESCAPIYHSVCASWELSAPVLIPQGTFLFLLFKVTQVDNEKLYIKLLDQVNLEIPQLFIYIAGRL